MSNRSKHLLSFSTLVFFALLFVGSATQKNAPSTPIHVATYDFKPPTVAEAKSSKIAFLLINPLYARSFRYTGIKIFSDFSKAMSADFNELLTAKGYSVRGPYDTYDAIIYGDKQESDLMLSVEIDLGINTDNVKWTSVYSVGYGGGQTSYKFAGDVILSGKVNLVASETLTKEKLLAKSISLEQRNVSVASEKIYGQPQMFMRAFDVDAGIIIPVSAALEDFYISTLNTAWNHLDPQELTPLKKQVDMLREKKKY